MERSIYCARSRNTPRAQYLGNGWRDRDPFQRTNNGLWGIKMVTWPMTSRDPIGAVKQYHSIWSAPCGTGSTVGYSSDSLASWRKSYTKPCHFLSQGNDVMPRVVYIRYSYSIPSLVGWADRCFFLCYSVAKPNITYNIADVMGVSLRAHIEEYFKKFKTTVSYKGTSILLPITIRQILTNFLSFL